MTTFLITTAIPYVNARPHLGFAYELVLADAMAGEGILFARQDYVEEAWRIVDPVLKAATPLYEYEIGTWGPHEVDEIVCPAGGWRNPIANATS